MRSPAAMRCWCDGHDSRRGEQRPGSVGDATRAGVVGSCHVYYCDGDGRLRRLSGRRRCRSITLVLTGLTRWSENVT